jgi:hypothetical protein
MKKVILSLLFVAAGLTAFADPSARVRIAYDGSNVTIRQDADKVSMEAFGTPSIAILVSGTKYAQWQDTNIEGLALEFTPAAESVSFEFSYVIGDLYLVDKQANSRTKIVAGATYDFTVEASQVGVAQANRFAISKIAGPEFCFNYNKLQLTKYDGATVEVFADGAATAALTQVVAGDAQFDIDLSTLASGKYKVVVSGIATPEEYIIDVKPAVTVVP